MARGKGLTALKTYRLLVQPFGAVKGVFLQELASLLQKALGFEAAAGPALAVPEVAYSRRRQQYRSRVFLEKLAELRNSAAGAGGAAPILLGITDVDLFVPELNFVFGQADQAGGVAVVSLARLHAGYYGKPPDDVLLKERALKESVHELGHVFGLPHCTNSGCIMYFSNSIADTDRKGPGFCPGCGARLNQSDRST